MIRDGLFSTSLFCRGNRHREGQELAPGHIAKKLRVSDQAVWLQSLGI
jgi:hypothetical protein